MNEKETKNEKRKLHCQHGPTRLSFDFLLLLSTSPSPVPFASRPRRSFLPSPCSSLSTHSNTRSYLIYRRHPSLSTDRSSRSTPPLFLPFLSVSSGTPCLVDFPLCLTDLYLPPDFWLASSCLPPRSTSQTSLRPPPPPTPSLLSSSS